MGKRKDTTGKVSPKAQKSMTIWEELYTDLAPNVAEALRLARVKPDQLLNMTDGDITAIQGINENGLEEIRSKYSPDLSVPQGLSSTGDLAEGQDGTAELGGETLKEATGPRPANKRHDFKNGKAIRASKSKVDSQKKYGIDEAVKLVKVTNITKFVSTVTLHLNLVTKDAPTRVEITFPFAAGAAKRVAIVTDELLAEIEKGKIEFDILVTSPAFMPKLAKYAKVLGPKGLMPSPKAGTVAADPEKKAKEFEGGKTVVKAESKFPLMHVTVGKINQPEAELLANIKALLDAIKLKNVTKATLASTMSPGIKLQLN
jgi:large subunit ribosomal protein L1